MSAKESNPRSNSLFLATMLILAGAVACWRFLPWSPKSFFGDDLSNFLAYKGGAFASNPIQATFGAYVEKYRPLFALVLGASFKILGPNVSSFIALNIAIQAVISTLVFLISLKLSSGRRAVSIAAGIAAAASRFALYQVTQVTGLVESVAFVFCLLTLYALARARTSETDAWQWSWLAVLFAFFSMHTHERYVVLAPWLCIAFLFNNRLKIAPVMRRATLLGAAAGTIIFNAIYKVAVLRLPFFVGTGGSKLGIDYDHVWGQLKDALLSIGGLNSGPAYLIGATWDSLKSSEINFLSGTLLTCAALVVIGGAIYRLPRRFEDADAGLIQRAYWPALLLSLTALLLIPPILTIRLEQRWLFAPFVTTLLLLTWASGASGRVPGLLLSTLTIIACACSTRIDTVYSRHFGDIFFVSAGEYADAVKRQVVDHKTPPNGQVILLTDPGSCTWTLQNGDFLRFYGKNTVHYACYGTASEALAASLPSSVRVYSTTSPTEFREVTQKWAAFVQAHQAKTVFDLIDEFPKGQISDPVAVPSSPSGRGAGLMQWNSDLGQRSTVTVITGFSYRFPAVPISESDQLRFAVGLIYPSHQPAHVRVLAAFSDRQPTVIFSTDVPPPGHTGIVEFIPMIVPLSGFSGRDVSFTFEVSSPGGDITGHWVGFAEPRVVDGSGSNTSNVRAAIFGENTRQTGSAK